MKTVEHLERAEGFLDLNMLPEAWEVTEELAAEKRGEPYVSELRLRILTASEKMELGESDFPRSGAGKPLSGLRYGIGSSSPTRPQTEVSPAP